MCSKFSVFLGYTVLFEVSIPMTLLVCYTLLLRDKFRDLAGLPGSRPMGLWPFVNGYGLAGSGT